MLSLGLALSRWISPRGHGPGRLETYESGELTRGTAWGNYSPGFYIVLMLFVIFEAELVLLFPWAVVYGDEYLLAAAGAGGIRLVLIECAIFVGLLLVGLFYVWVRGGLDWEKPTPGGSTYSSPVPPRLYDEFNEKYR